MYLSAPTATLASDHSVLFPHQLSGVLSFDLPHSLRAVSTPGWAVGVVVIDGAAQGETKRRARAQVVGGRKAGWLVAGMRARGV